MTGIALALALALVAFAAWGEVTRKAKLPGLLLPRAGMMVLAAPQAGVLAEILVREGDQVAAGQALMRLKSERMTQGGGEMALLNAQALAQRRASLDTERLLTQQQARQRQDALTERLRSLQAEERQALGELEANRLRVQLALKSQARYTELAKDGFVSAAQAQQKQEELLDLQLRERQAERSLQALQRDAQALRAEQQSSLNASQTSLAQLDRSLAALSQEGAENDARAGLTLTAPKAGRVSALGLHVGQAVQPGQTLVSLVATDAESADEAGQLEAQLYAPSRTAGFVRAGQIVWLRYAAYPYQKFGMAEGVVEGVSQSPVAPQDLPAGQAQALLTAAQANEPLYRISVRLRSQAIRTNGILTALKAGMTLEADVLQESRRVWEWVVEPVRTAASIARGLND
ncbi:HlyD family secretion protein [Paucibacter soli]|uniref:HlyD family secretion protein n=1 Tax=Paucibacter soli TaxID=3133433 RepID=UPI0030ABC409